jgi:hypothetical protein
MTLGNVAVGLLDFSAEPLPEDDRRAVLAFADVSAKTVGFPKRQARTAIRKTGSQG